MSKREEILERLLAILTSTATGGVNVYRNRTEMNDDELPAYVLLDGNENLSIVASDKRGPQLMIATPQVFYVPVPPDNSKNTGLGESVSQHYALLVKAIATDGPLKDIAGNNGYVEYRGMETDLNTGAEVQGQFRLDWAIAYVLNFNKL